MYNDGKMKVRIEIDTKTFVRFWLVVIGFVVAGLLLYSARTALFIVALSFFLALTLNPPVSKIASLLPGRSRIGGTALAYIAVVGFLVGFLFLVVPPIVEQTARFVQTVPETVEDVSNRFSGIDQVIDRYGIRDQVDQAMISIEENASAWAGSIGSNIVAGAGSLFTTAAAALIVLVLTFLMLVEGPVWMKKIWSIYPNHERMEYHKKLSRRMYSVVTGFVNGQLLVAFIAGSLSGLAVFILSIFFVDIPANLSIPIAVLVAITGIIPMFGATIGGIIAATLLGFNDLTAAIIFLIYFVVYQQFENNIISPSIQSKVLDLSPLTVLASVTIGIYMLGIVGGLISIPIAGCVKVLLQDYLERAKHERAKSQPTLQKLTKKLTKSAE